MTRYYRAFYLLIMHLIPLVIYREYKLFHLPIIEYFYLFVLALFSWTFIEYASHRWFFHKLKRRTPTIFNFLVFYALLYLTIPQVYLNTFFTFVLLDYMTYKQIHKLLHGNSINYSIGKYLQNYHLYHHSKIDNIKYGITSPFWDHIFRTINKR